MYARCLVAAGVGMFPTYLFMDLFASRAYTGYSYRDQTISELSAVGAPTRRFWLSVSPVHQALTFAFAFGVLRATAGRRMVRAAGVLVLLLAVSGPLWLLGPMHRREVLAAGGGTWQDRLHLALGGVSSVLFFGLVGTGALVFGRLFRLYSFATISLMLVFGMLMNRQVPNVARNEPTPWLGIWERIAIEGAMLWQSVFAARLLADRVGFGNDRRP